MVNDEAAFVVPPSWLECPELLEDLRALDAGGTARVMVMEVVGGPLVPLLKYLEG